MSVLSTPYFLLVDDDESVEALLRAAMAVLEIRRPLLVARDGEEALTLLQIGLDGNPSDPPLRLVILDCHMPVMGGIEFLRRLRQDSVIADTAVVMVTNSDAEQDREDALALGVLEYLPKPMDFGELVDLLAHMNNLLECMSEEAVIPVRTRN